MTMWFLPARLTAGMYIMRLLPNMELTWCWLWWKAVNSRYLLKPGDRTSLLMVPQHSQTGHHNPPSVAGATAFRNLPSPWRATAENVPYGALRASSYNLLTHLALHRLWMEIEVFLQWTDYSPLRRWRSFAHGLYSAKTEPGILVFVSYFTLLLVLAIQCHHRKLFTSASVVMAMQVMVMGKTNNQHFRFPNEFYISKRWITHHGSIVW